MAAKEKRNRVRGEGSVFQCKDGSWEARYQNRKYNDGKPVARKAHSEKEAYAKLEKIKEDLFSGQISCRVTNATVEEYMTEWVKAFKRDFIKDNSADRIEQTIRKDIVPYFGSRQLKHLSTHDIQKHIKYLIEIKKYNTMRKVYAALNECCRTAVMAGDLIRNPVDGVALPRGKKKDEVPYYTLQGEKCLIEAAIACHKTGRPHYRLGWMIPLVFNTGIRIGELAALQWEKHVDFENRYIIINCTQVKIVNQDPNAIKKKKKYIYIDQPYTKGVRGQRILELNDAAYEALQNLKKVTGGGKYVVSRQNHSALTASELDAMKKRIRLAAGFPDEKNYGMHALRHTYASKLFAKGVDIQTISEILGHSSVQVTYDIYIHLIEDLERRVLHIPDFD